MLKFAAEFTPDASVPDWKPRRLECSLSDSENTLEENETVEEKNGWPGPIAVQIATFKVRWRFVYQRRWWPLRKDDTSLLFRFTLPLTPPQVWSGLVTALTSGKGIIVWFLLDAAPCPLSIAQYNTSYIITNTHILNIKVNLKIEHQMDQLCRRTMILASTWHGWIVPRSAAVAAMWKLNPADVVGATSDICSWAPLFWSGYKLEAERGLTGHKRKIISINTNCITI